MNSPELKKKAAWDDSSIELIIGTLLRAGVLLSASVVLLGGIIYLVREGHAVISYRNFEGNHSSLRTFGGIAHGISQLRGRAIIQLGLLLLIAAPVARVIFSAFAFARNAITSTSRSTLTVLAVLLYSLFGVRPG